MKKILFVNMPIRINAKPNILPLGPLILSTHLNKIGHDAEILDLNSLRCDVNKMMDIVDEKITDKKYDIIAMSGLITTLKYQEMVSKKSRDEYLISGGGLATDIKDKLFEWIPNLDAINIGPGETSIDNIVEKNGSNTFYGANADNIDEWDIDFSLADIGRYIHNPIWGSSAKNSSSAPFLMKRSLNSVSSRGCPYSCKFCDREATGGKKYVMRSASSLVDEMEKLIIDYDIDFLGYMDDNAILDTNRLIEFNKLINNRNITLNWGAHARLDDIGRSEEKVKLLNDCNCIYLGFGGESANLDVLKQMNKGTLIQKYGIFKYEGREFPRIYVDALDYCRKYDIHSNLTWMMGYPSETLEQLKDTVSFILFMEDEGYVEKRYNNRSMFVATAYPNTELFETPVVQRKIYKAFNNFKTYVYSLGDATKLISSNDVVLNYSEISDDVFLEAKKYIEDDNIERILELS